MTTSTNIVPFIGFTPVPTTNLNLPAPALIGLLGQKGYKGYVSVTILDGYVEAKKGDLIDKLKRLGSDKVEFWYQDDTPHLIYIG